METSDEGRLDAQSARTEYVEKFNGEEARELAGLAFDQLIEDTGIASKKDLDYLKREILGCTNEVREKINKADPEAGIGNPVQDERPGESMMPYDHLESPIRQKPKKASGVPMDFFKMWDIIDTAPLGQ